METVFVKQHSKFSAFTLSPRPTDISVAVYGVLKTNVWRSEHRMASTILSSGLGKTGMQTAVAALKQGCPILDVIEAGIRPVEENPEIAHVGIGGAPNMLGQLELDAAIMDGDSLRIGAVGALKGYVNAIWVASKY
jgi:isoaspartyl peptidase/L-asparaginase-like protein (Ntn-hydrolase superfamily)